jgi:hypothetical protein
MIYPAILPPRIQQQPVVKPPRKLHGAISKVVSLGGINYREPNRRAPGKREPKMVKRDIYGTQIPGDKLISHVRRLI